MCKDLNKTDDDKTECEHVCFFCTCSIGIPNLTKCWSSFPVVVVV